MEVLVDLASVDVRMPAQEGVTENISPRGARVLTSKPWKPNDRLNVRSLLGNFRSRARVVYCVPVNNNRLRWDFSFLRRPGTGAHPTEPDIEPVISADRRASVRLKGFRKDSKVVPPFDL